MHCQHDRFVTSACRSCAAPYSVPWAACQLHCYKPKRTDWLFCRPKPSSTAKRRFGAAKRQAAVPQRCAQRARLGQLSQSPRQFFAHKQPVRESGSPPPRVATAPKTSACASPLWSGPQVPPFNPARQTASSMPNDINPDLPPFSLAQISPGDLRGSRPPSLDAAHHRPRFEPEPKARTPTHVGTDAIRGTDTCHTQPLRHKTTRFPNLDPMHPARPGPKCCASPLPSARRIP